MAEKHIPPKSFLIRISGHTTNSKRRIMLVRVSQTKEHHYFASLDELMIFFLQEFEQFPKGAVCME